jgi:hypothetical protein
MALPTFLGGPKSGYAELVANPRVIDKLSRKSKANLANASKVEEFSLGEWVLQDNNEELNKSNSGSAEPLAWPIVQTGKEDSDVLATGHYTYYVGVGWRLRTNGFNLAGGVTAADYTVGRKLCVKNGILTPAAGGEDVRAIVVKGAEVVQTGAEQVVGKAGFSTITVEVCPRGKA